MHSKNNYAGIMNHIQFVDNKIKYKFCLIHTHTHNECAVLRLHSFYGCLI